MAFVDEILSSARQEVIEAPMLPLSIVNSEYINVIREIPRGVKAHTFKTMTRYGVAEIITTRATSVPLFEDSQEDYLVAVYPVRQAFELEFDDLELAEENNQNIATPKMQGVRESIERELDIVGFEGRQQTTLKGISNNTNVTVYDFQANGDDNGTASASWEHKTAEQILEDLQTLAYLVPNQTANTVFADRLLLPVSKFNLIATKPYNSTGESILTVFRRNQASLPQGGIRDIMGHPALETAGTGGVGRAAAYYSLSRYNRFHIPQGGDFRDLPAEIQGTTYKVTAQMRTAGVEIQRIKEIAYANLV
ncbi:MAG: major capsid family protein [Cyanobacteria bacterium P01_A01_bin.80]